tara:strand:+ start:465 stop:923 length:459 start_codon:yes stop_codon:yes gene_type:complete
VDSEVKLRLVTKKDWDFILEIRNEKSALINFHNTEKVSKDVHKKYMEKLENDPKTIQWIIVVDGKNAGHIKIIGTELGTTISERFRRRGIGTKAYKLLFDEAKKFGLKKLTATIKIDRTIPFDFEEKLGWIKKEIIYKDGKPDRYYIEKNLK